MAATFHDILRELAEQYEKEVDSLSNQNAELENRLIALEAENIALRGGADVGALESEEGFDPRHHHANHEHIHRSFTIRWQKNKLRECMRSCFTSGSKAGHKIEDSRCCCDNWRCYKALSKIVKSGIFELSVAALVGLNAIFSAVEMQYVGLNSGYDIEFPGITTRAADTWVGAADVFKYSDYAFTGIFCVEMLLRLLVYRFRYFLALVNYIDIVAVIAGLLNIFADSSSSQASVFRLLRLVKLARGLRLVKMTRVLESLHFLIQSIRASMATLFWSLCVLLLIQCISGMVISQMVQEFLTSDTGDLAEVEVRRAKQEVYMYYGTFSRTMITMFEIHLANWARGCRVLVDHIGEGVGILFVLYRCLAGFAILNVINAVFIQQTLKVAQQDQDIMIMQKQKAQETNRKNILELFKELDKSGDGFLSREEFEALRQDSRLKTWLSCLDIDSDDAATLFDMLDDGDGDIDAAEFVKSMSSIKGPAKSIDMAQVIARTTRIEHKLNKLSAPDGQVSRRSRATRIEGHNVTSCSV